MAGNSLKKFRSPSLLESWDKTYLWHPFTQHYLWEKEPMLIVESGRGAIFKDIRGRSYIDGVSSLWVNLQGHGHPSINRAIRAQLSKIAHSTFLGLSHPPAILLGRELARFAPGKLKRTFYSDSGATAVEIALKMAYQYWIERSAGKKSRPEFLAVKGSYHGDTIGAVSVGGIGAFHSKFKPLLFKTHFAAAPACHRCPFNKTGVRHRSRLGQTVRFVPKPGQFRKETGCRWECLRSVESLLKKNRDSIAAGILEPVMQGAAGMVVLPEGYVAGFRRLLKKYGVLFIADEVATGFCRTGSLFACEQERAEPDIMCLAKSLTGGYSPLAATMTTENIFKTFRAPPEKMKTFFHGHSYTAHPLGAAAALENLRLIQITKLLEKTRRKAHLLRKELSAMRDWPMIGSIRQAGLMAGLEIVRSKNPYTTYPPTERVGARICRAMLKHGVWLRPLADTVVLMPPPVISEKNLRHMVRSLQTVLQNECKT